MPTIHDILAQQSFVGPYHIEGREAIANLFPQNKRCGIYVLHFADGMAYVGQSVDVTRRYVEHRRNHNDIQKISFKLVEEPELDEIESYVRDLLQGSGHRLRGVIGVVKLPGHADIDLVIPYDEQEKWRADLSVIDYSGDRMVNPDLRATYTGKFDRLKKKRFFSEFIALLREYVAIGLPKIRSTEDSFWACSCLPNSNVYSRINVNWQEVLSVYEVDEVLKFSFHFSQSTLENGDLFSEYFGRTGIIEFGLTADEEGYIPVFDQLHTEFAEEILDTFDLTVSDELDETMSYFFEEYPGMIISNHKYKPGGSDQINFTVQGYDQAFQLLQKEDIARSIRDFNMRLMRFGPCNYKSSHCLDLADLLVYESA